MREYPKKPENQSRTLYSNPRASRQAPILDILQAYKNRTLGRQPVQRESIEDEELLQGKFDTAQRTEIGIDEEKLLQGKFESDIQTEQEPIQREEKPNNIGLPNNLKTGIENLSGYSMEDVRVHYNSDKPTQLNALAYIQGTDIHVASGQEKYLPHELGHVIQQMKGKVSPTAYLDSVPVNDDPQLEKEADNFAGAIQRKKTEAISDRHIGKNTHRNIIQMLKISNDVNGLVEDESNTTSMVYAKFRKKPNTNITNKKYDYKVKSYKYTFGDANEDTVRKKIADVGEKAAANKFTSVGNRVTVVHDDIFTMEDNDVQTQVRQALHDSPNFYAPFILRLENINKHKNKGVLEDLAIPLNFDILFASGFYGYVVKVGDSHMQADDTPAKSLEYDQDNVPDAATIYEFAHKINDDNHAGKISDYATAWKGNDAERHKSADSITKVIGEGSRWQAVAALANRGNLKDSSVFYVDNADKESIPPQIKLSGLWKTWANPFKSKFGIPDDELKTELQKGNGNIATQQIAVDDRMKINVLEADNANYKLQ